MLKVLCREILNSGPEYTIVIANLFAIAVVFVGMWLRVMAKTLTAARKTNERKVRSAKKGTVQRRINKIPNESNLWLGSETYKYNWLREGNH